MVADTAVAAIAATHDLIAILPAPLPLANLCQNILVACVSIGYAFGCRSPLTAGISLPLLNKHPDHLVKKS
ncbi:hypothetical protein TRICHSKD4_6292 [Roseibium sp. TrichSKD4]|nr:hypothetical protein TRICHSKD4_6292 [Roseibium sp. TrichSKD4]